MTRDELEVIRERLEAARRQKFPSGPVRLMALQFAIGQRTIVYGVEDGFGIFLLSAQDDMEALLAVVEGLCSGSLKKGP